MTPPMGDAKNARRSRRATRRPLPLVEVSTPPQWAGWGAGRPPRCAFDFDGCRASPAGAAGQRPAKCGFPANASCRPRAWRCGGSAPGAMGSPPSEATRGGGWAPGARVTRLGLPGVLFPRQAQPWNDLKGRGVGGTTTGAWGRGGKGGRAEARRGAFCQAARSSDEGARAAWQNARRSPRTEPPEATTATEGSRASGARRPKAGGASDRTRRAKTGAVCRRREAP